MPDVTVLMPVYNGARFLAASIDSVLSQSHASLELIVVDDGSDDASASIVSRYSDERVRLIRNQRNIGLAAALNVGLASARGVYVARLDSDDVAHPDRVATQVAWLASHPQTALVGSLARLIDERGEERGTVRRPVSELGIRWYLLTENPFIHSTVMFRREAAMALGGYSVAHEFAEDFEFWGRFASRYDVANLDRPLIDYRQWSASVMASVERDPEGRRKEQLRQVTAALIRRHVANEFGGDPMSQSDAELLAGLTAGVETDRLDECLHVLAGLRARFESKWPAVGECDDYWRTLAGQYDALAYRLQPASRRASAAIYSQAIRSAPQLARHLSWPRAAASVLLGRDGRMQAARLFRRTTPS